MCSKPCSVGCDGSSSIWNFAPFMASCCICAVVSSAKVQAAFARAADNCCAVCRYCRSASATAFSSASISAAASKSCKAACTARYFSGSCSGSIRYFRAADINSCIRFSLAANSFGLISTLSITLPSKWLISLNSASMLSSISKLSAKRGSILPRESSRRWQRRASDFMPSSPDTYSCASYAASSSSAALARLSWLRLSASHSPSSVFN